MAATISEIASWIKANDRFALMAHIRPDGDSLGSTLAMRLALLQLGKQACVVYPGELPQRFGFLPGMETIADETSLPFAPESIIVLDVSDPVRLGGAEAVYNMTENRCVIDHHVISNCEVDRHYIDHEAAATGEILAELLPAMGVTLTKEIADCLYTAVSTDTGNFTFANTRPETLRVCADCVAAGTDVSTLTRILFRMRSQAKLKLLSLGISGVTYHNNGLLAMTLLTKDMFAEAQAVRSDSDGIVNFLMDTDGVHIAVIGEELDHGCKFSFRSIGDNDVAVLARQLGGGGHVHASGATLDMPLHEAAEQVLALFGAAVR